MTANQVDSALSVERQGLVERTKTQPKQIGNEKHKKNMRVLRGVLDDFDELTFGLEYGTFE